MKTHFDTHCTGGRTTLFAICLFLFIFQFYSAAATTGREDKGFLEKMEKWQGQMSEKFRDAWKSLRSDDKQQVNPSASVDLREDSDHYMVRLSLPGRDLSKLEVALQGETLRITAPAEAKVGRYEQTLALADANRAAEPKVERRQKDNLAMVTVAKSSGAARGKSSAVIPDPSLLPLSDWDRSIFEGMDRMRREMDRTFDEAFREFRGGPGDHGFFDESRFGSSIDLKEEDGQYVVRAYLPDRDVQNVNVTVNNQMLKIEAKEQQTTKSEDSQPQHSTRMAAYSQLVSLPGPVDVGRMKVEKKPGMLVITLPKAK